MGTITHKTQCPQCHKVRDFTHDRGAGDSISEHMCKVFANMAANGIVCDPCALINQERARKEEFEQFMRRRYEHSRLPGEFKAWSRQLGNVQLMTEVWRKRHESLLISGKSGTNKTRVVVAAAFKILDDRSFEGIMRYWRGVDLRSEMIRVAKADGFARKEFIEKLAKVDILILDDFDKIKFTEATIEMFYSLIDLRYTAQTKRLITWFTCNCSRDSMVKKISGRDGEFSDHAEPIVRRICDLCEGGMIVATKQEEGK